MIGVVAAWFPFVQLLSLTGLDTAAYHYSAKGQPDAFRVNLQYRLRWSLLSAGAFLSGSVYWFSRGDPLLFWMFIIAGVTFPLTAGLSACVGLLSAEQRFTNLFWYRIFESLTDFSGFIPLIFSTWAVSKVITFYGTNQLATMLMQVGVTLGLLQYLRQVKTRSLPPADRTEMVRYGRHLTGISLVSVVHTRIDAFYVGIFLPLQTMADYSIALILYEQLKKLWIIYTTIRYPDLVNIPVKQRHRRFLSEGSLVWIAFLLIGIAVVFVAFRLVPVLLPPVYKSSLIYISILTAAFVIGLPGNIAELFFRTCQDEKRQYLLRLLAAIAAVIGPLLLVNQLGGQGIAFGRLVSNLILSLAGFILFLSAKSKELPG
ncbi:MAG: hypothetical protein A2Z16_14950 [Chloroflexi bacterium RBG_16_54_18]|nr:MAG: hypothetical protein A2Z16_14950 [Chloroflexi bacterium RBG_16_54_18]